MEMLDGKGSDVASRSARLSLSLSLRDGDTVLLLLLHRSVTLGLGFFPFFPSLDAHARPLLVLR